MAKLIEVHLGEGHRLAIRLRTATAKAQAEHRRPGRPTNEKSDRRQLPQQQQPPRKSVWKGTLRRSTTNGLPLRRHGSTQCLARPEIHDQQLGKKLGGASARAAVPKLYIANEQADMFALLDALDRIMLELDTVDAEAMSDEQITDLSAVLLRQKMHRNFRSDFIGPQKPIPAPWPGSARHNERRERAPLSLILTQRRLRQRCATTSPGSAARRSDFSAEIRAVFLC
jgi:hypothetical protein